LSRPSPTELDWRAGPRVLSSIRGDAIDLMSDEVELRRLSVRRADLKLAFRSHLIA